MTIESLSLAQLDELIARAHGYRWFRVGVKCFYDAAAIESVNAYRKRDGAPQIPECEPPVAGEWSDYTAPRYSSDPVAAAMLRKEVFDHPDWIFEMKDVWKPSGRIWQVKIGPRNPMRITHFYRYESVDECEATARAYAAWHPECQRLMTEMATEVEE